MESSEVQIWRFSFLGYFVRQQTNGEHMPDFLADSVFRFCYMLEANYTLQALIKLIGWTYGHIGTIVDRNN